MKPNKNQKTCAITGCSRTDIEAKNLCRTHYYRLKRYGNPEAGKPSYRKLGYRKNSIVCSEPLCSRAAVASGLCQLHYQRKNKDRISEIGRRSYFRIKYGLTPADYASLLETQAGLCAICGWPPSSGRKLAVDHDHITGKVRGLLCDGCNRGLGSFRDNPSHLLRASKYLKKWGYKF